MKDLTKKLFADTIVEMVAEMPLSKVHVSELCARCGATKPTFYYHFQDKYELIAWMFLQDFLAEYGDKEPHYSSEALSSVTHRFERRKKFYQAAFFDDSQNSLRRYIIQFNIQISVDAVKNCNGGAELTDQELFAIKYHVYGIDGMLSEWLMGNNDMSIELLTSELFERTPDFLKKAFAGLKYDSEEMLRRTVKH